MTYTVLLTDGDLGDRSLEASWLEEELGAHTVIANCATAAEVAAEVRRVQPDAIVTQWAPIDAETIRLAAPRCQVISRVGIGLDMIDMGAASVAGVSVRNVPHYCTEEVATHATALALALWRRLPQLDHEVRSGTWGAASHAPHVTRLSNATLGLIGCGRIGRLVARSFEAWGTRIVVYDPAVSDDGYERVELDELAARADIISLHAPLLDSTHHIVNERFLASVQMSPVLVNTSRGGLVDVDAAIAAVESGRLRGLGLDVFESEPLEVGHAVRSAPSTLITPHAAWCSSEALPDLRRGAIDNVLDVLGNRQPVPVGSPRAGA